MTGSSPSTADGSIQPFSFRYGREGEGGGVGAWGEEGDSAAAIRTSKLTEVGAHPIIILG